MKKLEFDTSDGRGFLDATLTNLGSAKPGDVLVIRYSGAATYGEASALLWKLQEAFSALPYKIRTALQPIPVVIAREGCTWSLEPNPAG